MTKLEKHGLTLLLISILIFSGDFSFFFTGIVGGTALLTGWIIFTISEKNHD